MSTQSVPIQELSLSITSLSRDTSPENVESQIKSHPKLVRREKSPENRSYNKFSESSLDQTHAASDTELFVHHTGDSRLKASGYMSDEEAAARLAASDSGEGEAIKLTPVTELRKMAEGKDIESIRRFNEIHTPPSGSSMAKMVGYAEDELSQNTDLSPFQSKTTSTTTPNPSLFDPITPRLPALSERSLYEPPLTASTISSVAIAPGQRQETPNLKSSNPQAPFATPHVTRFSDKTTSFASPSTFEAPRAKHIEEPSTSVLDSDTLEKIQLHKRAASRHMENVSRLKQFQEQLAKDLENNRIRATPPMGSKTSTPERIGSTFLTGLIKPRALAQSNTIKPVARYTEDMEREYFDNEARLREIVPSLQRSMLATNSLNSLLVEVQRRSSQLEQEHLQQLESVHRLQIRQSELNAQRKLMDHDNAQARANWLQSLAEQADDIAKQARAAMTNGDIINRVTNVHNVSNSIVYRQPATSFQSLASVSTPTEQNVVTKGESELAKSKPLLVDWMNRLDSTSGIRERAQLNLTLRGNMDGIPLSSLTEPSTTLFEVKNAHLFNQGISNYQVEEVNTFSSPSKTPSLIPVTPTVPMLHGLDRLLPSRSGKRLSEKLSASDRNKIMKASLKMNMDLEQDEADSKGSIEDNVGGHARENEGEVRGEGVEKVTTQKERFPEDSSEELIPFITPITWRAIESTARAVERAATAAQTALEVSKQVQSPVLNEKDGQILTDSINSQTLHGENLEIGSGKSIAQREEDTKSLSFTAQTQYDVKPSVQLASIITVEQRLKSLEDQSSSDNIATPHVVKNTQENEGSVNATEGICRHETDRFVKKRPTRANPSGVTGKAALPRPLTVPSFVLRLSVPKRSPIISEPEGNENTKSSTKSLALSSQNRVRKQKYEQAKQSISHFGDDKVTLPSSNLKRRNNGYDNLELPNDHISELDKANSSTIALTLPVISDEVSQSKSIPKVGKKPPKIPPLRYPQPIKNENVEIDLGEDILETLEAAPFPNHMKWSDEPDLYENEFMQLELSNTLESRKKKYLNWLVRSKTTSIPSLPQLQERASANIGFRRVILPTSYPNSQRAPIVVPQNIDWLYEDEFPSTENVSRKAYSRALSNHQISKDLKGKATTEIIIPPMKRGWF